METFHRLTDDGLLAMITRTWQESRTLTVALLRLLQEVEQRRLHARLGYSSMFDFATRKIGLTESEAYYRIRAARAASRFPSILPMLERGTLTLSSVVTLNPYLDAGNAAALLQEAEGMNRDALQAMLAVRFPEAAGKPTLRKLPKLRPVGGPAPSAAAGKEPEPAGQLAALSSPPPSAIEAAPPAEAVAIPAGPLDGQRIPEAPARAGAVAPAGPTAQPAAKAAAPAESRPASYSLKVVLDAATYAALRELQGLLGPQRAGHDLNAVTSLAIVTLRNNVLQRRHGLRQKDLPPPTPTPTATSKAPATAAKATPRGASSSRRSFPNGSRHNRADAAAASPSLPEDDRTRQLPFGSSTRPQTPDARGAAWDDATVGPMMAGTGSGNSQAKQEASTAGAAPNAPPAGQSGKRSRYIDAGLRRAVFQRATGRCEFTSSDGTRCTAPGLEYHHHQVPFARGGEHSLKNLKLLCAVHHALYGELEFGRAHMAAAIARRRQTRAAPAAF
jgi:hypothetical protein